MRKYVALALALISVSIILAGCGETFSGIGKDVNRIGRGIKTVFVKEE